MATDKRLDQVSQLTDFDYALIVKGDQVAKASKQQLAELVGNLLYGATNASSLASVVAEQILPLKLKEFNVIYSEGSQLKNVSINDVTEAGVYYISGSDVTDIPESYGVLVVIKARWQVFHLYISNTNKIYARILWSANWSTWSTLN